MSNHLALRQRVLVVDDDPIFLALARSSLEGACFDVVTVSDGVEALEALAGCSFDAALIDLSMPRIDGFRLIGLVRGSPRLWRLAIVVVTARRDTEAEREALALGADGHERKPIDWALLGPKLREVIDAREPPAWTTAGWDRQATPLAIVASSHSLER